MSQFLRPDGIVTAGLWSGNINTTNYYLDIDEASRDDSDYAQSNANITTLGEVSLSNAQDPQQTTGRTLRYVLRRTVTNKNLTIVIRLMEGSTTIAGWTHANPSGTFTLFEQSVTGTITNYANLSVQMEVTVNAGGNNRAQVTWVEFEIPDAVRTSKMPCYLKGSVNATSKISCYLAGPSESKSSMSCFTRGAATISSSMPAYLTGPLPVKSNIPCYMEGWGQDLLADGDIAVNVWHNEIGGTILFPSLADENNGTYATLDHAGIDDWFEISLEDAGTLPEGNAYFEWTAWRQAGSEAISMRAELRQGEDIIATDERVLSDTPTLFHRDLTVAEKASITSPIDLRLRFIVTGVS